jgi:hypothetical protein
MKRCLLAAVLALSVGSPASWAYVEAPHTLGRCCHESTNVMLVEVTRVDKTKNLILYKKLEDLKGRHATDQIKHNIGTRGFHEREWKTVMAWAEVGKKAVFFHNGGASETCIGGYWYQCYPEGEWWGMSHAEPLLLRSFHGDPDKLATAVKGIVAGREVVVPCLADGPREQLLLAKGKLQRLKASLKRMDYDQKRDFVGFGAGDGEEENFEHIVILPASSTGWKYLPALQAAPTGDRWRGADFDDRSWRDGRSPIGYGEEEINKRGGTTVPERGTPFVFRRSFDVSSDLLAKKGATFNLSIASDDSAVVYLNGEVVDEDSGDHEFTYWNRDVALQAKQLKPGRNVIAVLVRNQQQSSDLFLDVELSAEVPVPKKAAKTSPADAAKTASKQAPKQPAIPPSKLQIDKAGRAVTLTCFIAPRKLPHLNEVYPIEVIATYQEGQKAHETVVIFAGIKPSEVHKALESLGLKPGKPAKGEGAAATGPEVKISLEVPGKDGKPQRLPLEAALVDRKTGKPLTAPLKWHFTGSAMRQLDPEKPGLAYAADATGTLISMFPVTDDTVLQSSLTMKDEASLKLETNAAVLPKEGTAAKLVIEAK